jgi:uncharacterized protein YbbC (DUF1343 family)
MVGRFGAQFGVLWGLVVGLAAAGGDPAGPGAARLPACRPAEVGLDEDRLGRIEQLVNKAVQDRQLPGAVVGVVRHGRIAYRRAFGLRGLQPAEAPMTTDTVFDLASLTKPVATATSVMLLLERGRLRLDDPVAKHLPEFGANGKEAVTVEQLLTHTSGLLADNEIGDYAHGAERAWERICQLGLKEPPGAKFIYSDVGFIVLGRLVEKLGGRPLDVFARQEIFEPLGMAETGFLPPAALRERAAPTERRGNSWLTGVVHDPRAHALGGVAGHAGLFSTVDDLAIYVQMLLARGTSGGRQFLQPDTVRLMTSPRPVPGGLRAFGWDVQTAYSANRGSGFPAGESFGHTGFTGTSLWVDPTSDTAVIFLSNRVHPDGKGNVNRLRGEVATAVAAAIVRPPFPGGRPPAEGPAARPATPVLTGIDVLRRDGFRLLKGRRIGLVTNHTGLAGDGTPTVDLLHAAEGVTLVALFSPEHGLRGIVDQPVPDGKDPKTGLPIYSLYGERKKPTREQLAGVDTLVYDIQDIGCRFYTYISTLGLVLEAAAENGIKVVVLDRPNPIGGVAVAGPVRDPKRESFTAYHALPVRHGLTVGELALLFNSERGIKADVEVVKVEGWRREDLFDRTGLLWVNPSPNMRGLTAALLYPGIGLLETTNLSVGRGTDRPFEVLGAPWLDGRRLAAALRDLRLPGVRFVPVRFTPAASTFRDRECAGVQIFVDDWERFEPLRTGLSVAATLRRLYPREWEWQKYERLLCHAATLAALERQAPPEEVVAQGQGGLDEFLRVRQRYLLYP